MPKIGEHKDSERMRMSPKRKNSLRKVEKASEKKKQSPQR